ncbi:MAG TPA: MFS transporter [Steroidobacteraceae bacterium]
MSAAPIDYEDAPLMSCHRWLIVGATTGYVSDGYTLGVVGIALASAQHDLALTPQWLGWLGGASLVGLLVGALLSGSLADRLGRRVIFAYNMAAFVALSLLQLFAQSAVQLLVLRFLLGVVLGTDYVVVKALLAEFMPRLNRGRALSLMGVAWAAGFTLAYLAGFLLKDSNVHAWRLILASSALPALLALPLRMRAPESPLWLQMKGRLADAQRVLDATLGPGFGVPAVQASRNLSWIELLRGYGRATFVGSTLYVCLVIPYFAVSTFIPQVMAALKVAGSGAAGLLYIVGLLLGSLAGFWLVDAFPRRAFVIGSFALTSAALLVCTGAAYLPAAFVVISFAVFSCVLSAAQAQIYVYLPELFPTAVRASGIGFAVAVSRLGAAAGTSLLPLTVARFGVVTALWVCLGVLVTGGLVCLGFAPETRRTRLAAV